MPRYWNFDVGAQRVPHDPSLDDFIKRVDEEVYNLFDPSRLHYPNAIEARVCAESVTKPIVPSERDDHDGQTPNHPGQRGCTALPGATGGQSDDLHDDRSR